jgi:hypothetical protein
MRKGFHGRQNFKGAKRRLDDAGLISEVAIQILVSGRRAHVVSSSASEKYRYCRDIVRFEYYRDEFVVAAAALVKRLSYDRPFPSRTQAAAWLFVPTDSSLINLGANDENKPRTPDLIFHP